MREYIECTLSYKGLKKIIFEDHTSMLAKYASQLIAPAKTFQKISNCHWKITIMKYRTRYLSKPFMPCPYVCTL